jgi:hypothetical protein
MIFKIIWFKIFQGLLIIEHMAFWSGGASSETRIVKWVQSPQEVLNLLELARPKELLQVQYTIWQLEASLIKNGSLLRKLVVAMLEASLSLRVWLAGVATEVSISYQVLMLAALRGEQIETCGSENLWAWVQQTRRATQRSPTKAKMPGSSICLKGPTSSWGTC